MLQFVPICAQTHTFQNPASIWKCKKWSQNRETLGIIQLHGQDRVGQFLHRTKGPKWGGSSQPMFLLPSTLAWALHRALYPRGGSSGRRILVPQGASCSNSPKGTNIDKSRALFKATIKVISLTSFRVLCIFLLHAGQFHLVTKLKTEQG